MWIHSSVFVCISNMSIVPVPCFIYQVLERASRGEDNVLRVCYD